MSDGQTAVSFPVLYNSVHLLVNYILLSWRINMLAIVCSEFEDGGHLFTEISTFPAV